MTAESLMEKTNAALQELSDEVNEKIGRVQSMFVCLSSCLFACWGPFRRIPERGAPMKNGGRSVER